jgi:hypothetical protein
MICLATSRQPSFRDFHIFEIFIYTNPTTVFQRAGNQGAAGANKRIQYQIARV